MKRSHTLEGPRMCENAEITQKKFILSVTFLIGSYDSAGIGGRSIVETRLCISTVYLLIIFASQSVNPRLFGACATASRCYRVDRSSENGKLSRLTLQLYDFTQISRPLTTSYLNPIPVRPDD